MVGAGYSTQLSYKPYFVLLRPKQKFQERGFTNDED